eukprot:2808567-Amphidinium_carterae.1
MYDMLQKAAKSLQNLTCGFEVYGRALRVGVTSAMMCTFDTKVRGRDSPVVATVPCYGRVLASTSVAGSSRHDPNIS